MIVPGSTRTEGKGGLPAAPLVDADAGEAGDPPVPVEGGLHVGHDEDEVVEGVGGGHAPMMPGGLSSVRADTPCPC